MAGSAIGAFFGYNDPTPKQMLQEFKKVVREQKRECQRSLRDFSRQEKQLLQDIKKAAKNKDSGYINQVAKTIAKGRVQTRYLNTMTIELDSMLDEFSQMLFQLRTNKVLKHSAKLMKSMNSLMKYSEMNENVRNLAQEMAKAGIIEDLVEDAIETTVDEDEAIEEETNKIMEEVMSKYVGTIESAPVNNPTANLEEVATTTKEEPEQVAA